MTKVNTLANACLYLCRNFTRPTQRFVYTCTALKRIDQETKDLFARLNSSSTVRYLMSAARQLICNQIGVHHYSERHKLSDTLKARTFTKRKKKKKKLS